MSARLGRLEAVVDASGVPGRIEALLPRGVRRRQLGARTLLVGMLLTLADGRPAHLTRLHAALVSLKEADRRRLGIVVEGRAGAHLLTYRQVERTFSLVVVALAKAHPDGAPARTLQGVLDALLEASVPEGAARRSRSLALDWTDVESFSTRRPKPTGTYADPDAAWGHRKGGGPGEKDELFFGYYLSLATMVTDEGGAEVAEVVRRMQLVSCARDPVPPMVDVLVEMPRSGVSLGDVVADSGYAHRVPASFALALRGAGASLVMDLHPHDRGTQGTHRGAVCCNGNLYCPASPPALFDLQPPGRAATPGELEAHDRRCEELSRYKLGRIGRDDPDGHHRVMCPAAMGKLRCALRPDSMALGLERPELLSPPEHPPACCTNVTLTVQASVNAKTAQRLDYLSKPWRRSYARRSAAERSNARIKDPATVDVARGWCRVMGLPAMSLFVACAVVVRNLAVADAFEARQADARRRTKLGLPPRTRRRRRTTIADLLASATTPP